MQELLSLGPKLGIPGTSKNFPMIKLGSLLADNNTYEKLRTDPTASIEIFNWTYTVTLKERKQKFSDFFNYVKNQDQFLISLQHYC